MIRTNTPLHRLLVWIAILTAVSIVGTIAYQYTSTGEEEGELNYRVGNLRLEDERYDEALAEFDELIREKGSLPEGHLGRGLALMGLNYREAALQSLNTALDLDPEFASAFANRGILLDRMGRPHEALADYRQALKLDPGLAEGPGWMTRFFRNQWERPPSIADRAGFLSEELKKPASQQVLQVPEVDAEQRPYKYEGQ